MPWAGPPSAVTGRHSEDLKESWAQTRGLKNNHVSVLAGDVSGETDERQLLRGMRCFIPTRSRFSQEMGLHTDTAVGTAALVMLRRSQECHLVS